MYIVNAKKKDYKKFIDFQKEIYKYDTQFRDLQSVSLPDILEQKAQITKGSYIEPYLVYSDECKIEAVFILAVIDRMPDTMQIAFLDFVDKEEVFGEIYRFAKQKAKEKSTSKILIGLNLHVNYGLGLLADSFGSIPSFGSAYNKEYYTKHIEKYMKPTDTLYSYKIKISEMDVNLSDRLREYISKNFIIRKADFKNIKETAAIYTQINNRAFVNHKYYYTAREEEDIELLSSFRYLIKEENLLFVYHNEKPVGFMLWYPDFNQLLGIGKRLGIFSVLKYKLDLKKIDTVKITEFGVLPEYKNSGAVIALLDYFYKLRGNDYVYLESGWIMKSNKASTAITSRFMKNKYKTFKVYEELL